MPTKKTDDKKSIIRELNHKLYEINKEKIKENSAKYYAANKEELNKQIMCDCGFTYAKRNKSIHLKTKAHVAYLKGVNDGKKSILKTIKKGTLSKTSNSEDSSDTETSSSDSDSDE